MFDLNEMVICGFTFKDGYEGEIFQDPDSNEIVYADYETEYPYGMAGLETVNVTNVQGEDYDTFKDLAASILATKPTGWGVFFAGEDVYVIYEEYAERYAKDMESGPIETIPYSVYDE